MSGKGGSDDNDDDNDYEDVPTEADMCASAEQRFKPTLKSDNASDTFYGRFCFFQDVTYLSSELPVVIWITCTSIF